MRGWDAAPEQCRLCRLCPFIREGGNLGKQIVKSSAPATDWESLGISNDYLFGRVMTDPQLCIGLLKRILPEVGIGRIRFPHLQKAIRPEAEAKGIRLDVYVGDENGTVYDIEMQAVPYAELPKRSRYYSGVIDLQLIDRGQEYSELNRSYVIFICLNDLFGRGRHIYTFENLCRQEPELALGDGTVRIFLNAKGKIDDVSEELGNFLAYVADGKPRDAYTRQVDEAVKRAKRNRKWRHEYMTQWLRDQDKIREGRREGIRIARTQINLLHGHLVREKRYADLERSTRDEQYQDQLLEEYGIE